MTLIQVLILIIVLLLIWLCCKNSTINHLKEDINECKKNKKEIEKEHDYYYKLAKALWENYREYDIFPSKFAREIDDIGRRW